MGLRRTYTEEEKREILSRYPKESIAKIGKTMGIWPPNVRKILVEAGVQIRICSHPDSLADEIRNYLENTTLTRKEICQRIGKGKKMYDRLVKKFNIKRKYKIK